MKKVIIMVDTARATGRKFLRGLERYLRTSGPWQVSVCPPDYALTTQFNLHSWFQLQEAAGLIALDSKYTADILQLQIPKIIHDTQRENPDTSTLYTNSVKTGEMAAEYFMGLGFQHFAFCGFEGLAWSDRRFSHFSDYLKRHGRNSIFYYHDQPDRSLQSKTIRQDIADWLARLPKPICVFACNDDRGVSVLEACKIAELRVPEAVAVLGVDNDELVCDLSSPPLSSIELNFERAGFRAARLLDDMMALGITSDSIVVEPVEIVTRPSSDVFAVDDAQLVQALVFIREHFQEAIQVRDVVAATILSRRDLELKFKKKLGRSIKEEINRLRIESVKQRLINTHETIYAIADSLAYTDAQHFGRFFKQVTGESPKQYRQAHKPFA